MDNEEKYKAIKTEILGEDSEESGSDEESSDEEDEDEGMQLTWIYTIFSDCSNSRGSQGRHRRSHRDQLGQPTPNHLFDHHERTQL